MLLSRFGIELLESKIFTGETTINDDNSISVKYNGKNRSFENPMEQSKRHAKLLNDFISENFDFGKRIKLLGEFSIQNTVLINPKTTITNKILPANFCRSLIFRTQKKEFWNLYMTI